MHLALLLSVTVWFGGADGDPQDAVKQVFREFKYQEVLVPPEVGGSGGGTWSRESWEEQLRRQNPRYRRLPRQRGAPTRRERELQVRQQERGSGGFALFDILVWVALGIAVLTILASLMRGRSQRQQAARPAVAERDEAERAALDRPRSAAVALAAEGRYDEAVHQLLLQTIEALVASRSGGVPVAWTSREIQADSIMPSSARGPFGGLVDGVEQSLFGGRPVDEEAWKGCLERFHAFEAAYRTAPR